MKTKSEETLKREKKERRQKRLQTIADETGLSLQEAKDLAGDAKQRLGITLADYVRSRLWEIPVEYQDKEYAHYLKRKEKRKLSRQRNRLLREEKNEKYIGLVCEESGWDYDTALSKMTEAKDNLGCDFDEYYMYRFYKRDVRSQSQYFLMGQSRAIRKKYNGKLIEKITENKMVTNTLFDILINRKWCVTTAMSFEDFCSRFQDVPRIIYKPLNGSRGNDIRSFELSENNMREVYNEIRSFREGLVEEYIIQHEALLKLNPSSVNTFRLVTVSWLENCEIKMDIAYGFLRIGNGKIVDNLHSGGMAAAVDLETGIVCTDAADHLGHVYEKHPATGTKIKGLEIPLINMAKKRVKETIRQYKITGYIAWDLAITEDGPELVELNRNPGPDGLQIPYAPQNKGMRHVMDKYLEK